MPEKTKNTNSERYMHLSVHCSTIYDSQDMEVTKKSTNRWVDKEQLLHVQMEYSLVKKMKKCLLQHHS